MITHALSAEGVTALNTLVGQVEADLFNPANIRFFAMVHADPVTVRDAQNAVLLAGIGRLGGVYAIWVQSQTGIEVCYVGHTDGKYARTRIRNHFIHKDPRTGSQLANVNVALAQGSRVGVSFVAIDPPALRLYIENLLIRAKNPLWNIKGAGGKRVPDLLATESLNLPSGNL